MTKLYQSFFSSHIRGLRQLITVIIKTGFHKVSGVSSLSPTKSAPTFPFISVFGKGVKSASSSLRSVLYSYMNSIEAKDKKFERSNQFFI